MGLDTMNKNTKIPIKHGTFAGLNYTDDGKNISFKESNAELFNVFVTSFSELQRRVRDLEEREITQ